jgi:RNA polymerase sigma-70 factor (ECF subfamily)
MHTDHAIKITPKSPAEIRKPRTPDKTLVEMVARGDQSALRVLYARHSQRIYNFALRLSGSSTIAEETVSDVFLEVWRHGASFQGKSQVSTWLLGIARNKALSARRFGAEVQCADETAFAVEDDADNPEETLAKQDRSSIVQRCLRELPRAQREVIDLFYLREKSLSEIVDSLGALRSTVKTRIFYARNRMAELLQQAGIDSACA